VQSAHHARTTNVRDLSAPRFVMLALEGRASADPKMIEASNNGSII
jgi:hypothetical protein